MTDYLNIQMTPQEIGAVSNLGLAHIGDCVYEMLVRSYIVVHGGVTNQKMHQCTVDMVRAPAQAAAMEKLLPLLTEEELSVYRRGRNTRVHSVPKNALLGDYHAATGLECLFGWLYLSGQHARINALFAVITEN
ncbi:MAG: ribonuclease III [Ruminococcaceae bacterium]|jgi:ribonuclease-3 family protein|nr:ribonuclease III [Oscillospiraceae bacterium]